MKLLNKKYWEEIKERFPEEFEKFMKWMDNYSQNEGTIDIPSCEYFIFDLPDAMQIGVFYQYTTEIEKFHPFVIDKNDTIEFIVKSIKVWFFEEYMTKKGDQYNNNML